MRLGSSGECPSKIAKGGFHFGRCFGEKSAGLWTGKWVKWNVVWWIWNWSGCLEGEGPRGEGEGGRNVGISHIRMSEYDDFEVYDYVSSEQLTFRKDEKC